MIFMDFISNYGIWVIALFIALESIGLPLPAEAALMTAAFFAAKPNGPDILSLIVMGVGAAIIGEVIGFWIGRKFGCDLLLRHGHRFGFTEERIKIGQWLFARFGGAFVFIARFLPFLRNIAAMLAGMNCMPKGLFYVASATAASTWVIAYGLGSYFLGAAFMNSASPIAISLAVIISIILIAVPATIARYENAMLAKAVAFSRERAKSED